jgi:excisionase family DNA binding protein
MSEDPPPAQNPEQLLVAQQVADYLNISLQTLRIWTNDPAMGIPHFRLGSKIRYRRVELDDWLESRRHTGGKPLRDDATS